MKVDEVMKPSLQKMQVVAGAGVEYGEMDYLIRAMQQVSSAWNERCTRMAHPIYPARCPLQLEAQEGNRPSKAVMRELQVISV